MAFKLFENTRSGAASLADPAISVKKDAMYINMAAKSAFDVDAFSHVQYFPDDEANRVGIKLLDGPEKHALRINQGQSSRYLSAKTLIRSHNIKPGLYPLGQDEETGMLVFEYEKAEEGEAEAKEYEVAPKRARSKKAA